MCKTCSGFEQLGLTTLPSVASPFSGRSPATPTSASWPPRRVFWRIPSKSPPFSCSLAVPRAWKGGLQARQIHQKALASKSEETSQSPHLNFGLIGTLPNPRVVRLILLIIRPPESTREERRVANAYPHNTRGLVHAVQPDAARVFSRCGFGFPAPR